MPSQQADSSPFWNVLSAAHCPVMCLASLKACTQCGLLLSRKGVRASGMGAERLCPLGDRERPRGLSSALSIPCVNVRKGGVPFRC